MELRDLRPPIFRGVLTFVGIGAVAVLEQDPWAAMDDVEQLGVEFLAAKPGTLALAYNLLQKRRREVGPIVICRATRDYRGRIGEQFAKWGARYALPMRHNLGGGQILTGLAGGLVSLSEPASCWALARAQHSRLRHGQCRIGSRSYDYI